MGNNEVRKVCGFYINDWHLTTMILPYIHSEIEKENSILTILQSGIKENIEELLSKMNLNKKLQQNILNIDWKTTKIIKYTTIKEKIQNINGQRKDINILVCGEKEYIETANEILEKVLGQLDVKNKINIINCYNVTEFNNVSEVEKKHDYIINTSGIKKVEEVFKPQEKVLHHA